MNTRQQELTRAYFRAGLYPGFLAIDPRYCNRPGAPGVERIIDRGLALERAIELVQESRAHLRAHIRDRQHGSRRNGAGLMEIAGWLAEAVSLLDSA